MAVTPKRRRFRPIRWLQRVMLGAMMSFVAFVVEKRLVRALRKERKPAEGQTKAVEEEFDVTTGYDVTPSRGRRR